LKRENENQIEKFLSENPNFSLLEQKQLFPSEGFDGFYMAKLIRN
jgi:16S rRNA (cytosine967-C5)-methyltransferase